MDARVSPAHVVRYVGAGRLVVGVTVALEVEQCSRVDASEERVVAAVVAEHVKRNPAERKEAPGFQKTEP